MSEPIHLNGDHYWKFRCAALDVALAEEQAARLAAEAKLQVLRAHAKKDRVIAELVAAYPAFEANIDYRADDRTCTLTKDE